MNQSLTFMILFNLFAYTDCSQYIRSSELSQALIDQHNQPTPALLELLTEAHTCHSGTLPSIASATQSWLRPAGKERWEFHTNPIVVSHNLPRLLSSLCLTQNVEPLGRSYDYALLLGGTLDDVRTRLAYLITLWNKGVRFNSLLVLTGQRPLDTTLESHELLLNNNIETLPSKKTWHFTGKFPTTEPEMIMFVLEQTKTPTPWDTIPCFFIDTPLQKTETNSLRRPNTQDTILQWLRECNPPAGSILAISNQPFVGYQNAVLRKNMPPHFTIETVGSSYQGNESIATMIDALARWIYNENQILHQQSAKY